jgi:phosphate transport system permease protein
METAMRVLFSVVVAAMIIPVLVVIIYLFYRAAPVLTPSFLLENPKNYMTAGGIWAPLVGTFYLAIISLVIDAPIGILAAIYLNEYAPDNWFTRTINLAVLNLAGVPSIVHGLFGFGAFVLFARMGKSVLAASCTLAVMSLPVIITSAREALASVPMSFREACWNMGATRWQTIRTVVLPNSLSGILTGVIFEICRTAGETAPILFTGAVFFAPVADSGIEWAFPYGLFDTCMALQYHLFTLSTQVRGVSEELQFGTAAVLIGLTLLINTVSISLRLYFRSRKKW